MREVTIGLDIGGTKFLVAAADESGQIVSRKQEPSPAALDDGLRLLNDQIGDVAGGAKIRGIGAAIGGPLSWHDGVVSPLHQPAWRDVPLKQMMEDRWGCPFYVDVDTNVAALGEYASLPQKPGRLLYITISTGMGGGFLVDGKVYRGMDGAHPEIAHQAIPFRCSNPAGVRCECGLPDCLEALVSGNGIRRIYGKAAERLESHEWQEVAFNLGQGLRNIAVILLPEQIVLGGGVALGGGEKLLQVAYKVMEERLRIVPAPVIRLSTLGYDTALIGALHLARLGVG